LLADGSWYVMVNVGRLAVFAASEELKSQPFVPAASSAQPKLEAGSLDHACTAARTSSLTAPPTVAGVTVASATAVPSTPSGVTPLARLFHVDASVQSVSIRCREVAVALASPEPDRV
jgi:hypothetical protein